MPAVVRRELSALPAAAWRRRFYTGFDQVKRVQALIEGGPAGGIIELPGGIRIIKNTAAWRP
jgi:hypothetical protein